MGMDPMVASSLVSGAGSIGTGLLNALSQRSTNKTNLKIAQINNEFNERMQDKQNAWNLEQWTRENEYNSAAAQVERYKAAGLNPYMMMSGQSAGIASSLNSAPAAPADQSGRQNPVDYSILGNGFNTLFNNLIQAQIGDSQVAKNRADTRQADAVADQTITETNWINRIRQAEFDNMIYNNKKLLPAQRKALLAQSEIYKAQTYAQQYDNDMRDNYEVHNSIKCEYVLRNQLVGQQIASYALDNAIKHEQLPYIAPHIRAEISQMMASVAQSKAVANLSDKQAEQLFISNLFSSFGGLAKKATEESWEEMFNAYCNGFIGENKSKHYDGAFSPIHNFLQVPATIAGAVAPFYKGGAAAAGAMQAPYSPVNIRISQPGPYRGRR